MSEPISIAVDVTNPGQFFACCGLLELADRLWPGAEAWFERISASDHRRFRLAFQGTIKELLATLLVDQPEEITELSDRLSVKPLIAPLRFSLDGWANESFTLDAWMTVRVERGQVVAVANSPWNFWSGQQTSFGIWTGLRSRLAFQLARFVPGDFENLFSKRLIQKGRFGFDPGPAWDALDVGFSPNEQGMEVESSPSVELLAAVGLQRFRPVIHEHRESFDYYTWHRPYAPALAAAAMAGAIREKSTVRYRAHIVSRGQYSALSFAHAIRQGASDE